jgi:hypothetical protein
MIKAHKQSHLYEAFFVKKDLHALSHGTVPLLSRHGIPLQPMAGPFARLRGAVNAPKAACGAPKARGLTANAQTESQ